MKHVSILAFLSLSLASPTRVERRAEGCATLPSSVPLPSNTFLPDPFTFLDGTKVKTASDWQCRQGEINSLLQKYELGTLPGKPDSQSATFSGNTLSITNTVSGKSINWSVSITNPTGTGPFPAIIAYGAPSIPVPSGIAVITFNNDQLGVQNDASSRGQGLFYNLYGSGATGSAMIAWAWGVSRILDALESTPAANIDTKRVGVTGCSRNGKGALVAGAFEPRIALTIPQESGSGGDACWRLSDVMLAQGQQVQTLSEIVTENVWFSTEFATFSGKTNTLPFDHHMLAGLVAPRPMLAIENAAYLWLGPWSDFGCMKAAHTIWEALGVPDKMGFSEVGNHSHCQFPSSESPDLNAYLNKFLLNQSLANTNIFKNDQNIR